MTAEYPPVWRRFAAIVYDSLLVTATVMAYGGISLFISQQISPSEEHIVSGIGFQIGGFVVIYAFFCFFWIKAGQTLGMRAWRLQIIKQDLSSPPSIVSCVIRLTLAPIGLALFPTALFRNDKQCLHDLASKTQVILLPKEKKK